MNPLRHAIRAALRDTQADSASFCFAPDSPVFAGHFPQQPVLPAVVQIMMVQEVLAAQGRASQLASVRQAKFLAPVGPNLPLELRLDCAKWPTVQASLHSPMGQVAKLQLDVM